MYLFPALLGGGVIIHETQIILLSLNFFDLVSEYSYQRADGENVHYRNYYPFSIKIQFLYSLYVVIKYYSFQKEFDSPSKKNEEGVNPLILLQQNSLADVKGASNDYGIINHKRQVGLRAHHYIVEHSIVFISICV